MDLQLSRHLAQLGSVLHLLKSQRDVLTELADIKEIRNLEESFLGILRGAYARGLIPSDPLAMVREDWLRLVDWSNRVQDALKQADALRDGVSAAASGVHRFPPTSETLQSLELELEGAPDRLRSAMERLREEMRESDWEGLREDFRSRLCFLLRVRAGIDAARVSGSATPYAELIQVAETMGWDEALELCEFAGWWARDLTRTVRPLVASRLAVETGSPFVLRRIQVLKKGLEQVKSLLELHKRQIENLREIRYQLDAGNVESARSIFASLKPVFGDLDYQGTEVALTSMEQQLATHGRKLDEANKDVTELEAAARAFFVFPPNLLYKRLTELIPDVESVLLDAKKLVVTGRNGSADRMLLEKISPLDEALERVRSFSNKRLWLWSRGLTAGWIIFLITGAMAALQLTAAQSEKKRTAGAEAKEREVKKKRN
jgi:hypothetical protein